LDLLDKASKPVGRITVAAKFERPNVANVAQENADDVDPAELKALKGPGMSYSSDFIHNLVTLSFCTKLAERKPR
jgi:hypothetical protein